MNIKVVLKQTILRGSNHPDALHLVAVVYIEREEFRVSAPPAAEGDAADWSGQWLVHRRADDGFAGEIDCTDDPEGVIARHEVLEELEKKRRDAVRPVGMNPDGIHWDAQICLKGHVLHCDGAPFDPKAFCTKCGARCIDECPQCKEPIRGPERGANVNAFPLPLFCHKCGRPYPWMEAKLATARDLLWHDQKLTLEDRNALWSDLQYVMSDPKSDLAPAKRKLIDIRLAGATQAVREGVLDLMAKIVAELIKGQ